MFLSITNSFAVVGQHNKGKPNVLHISTILWEGATLPDVKIKTLVINQPVDCESVSPGKAAS